MQMTVINYVTPLMESFTALVLFTILDMVHFLIFFFNLKKKEKKENDRMLHSAFKEMYFLRGGGG